MNFAAVAREALLNRFAPPSVLVDESLTVLHYNGPIDAFLAQPGGRPTHDLIAMARPGLVRPLRIAAHKAMQNGGTVTAAGHVSRGGARISVRIEASKLAAGYSESSLLVSFLEEAATALPDAGESSDLGEEDEIKRLRSELRNTQDDASIKNEELLVSNEEIVSMNEELQSTNEELESSKEELQSLNEELTTINAQLKDKVEELQLRTTDLDNLLNSTEVATLFLDTNRRIRWYAPSMSSLMSLTPTDLGRPIGDLSRKFHDPAFDLDIEDVPRTLTPREQEVQSGDGRWFIRRIAPYRIGTDRIDGLVVTLIEITARRSAELAAGAAGAFAHSIVETVSEPLVVLDAGLQVRSANPAYFQAFRGDPAATVGRHVAEIGAGALGNSELIQALQRVLEGGEPIEAFEIVAQFAGIGRRIVMISARRIADQHLVLLTLDDVTSRRAAEETARQLSMTDNLTGLPNRALFRDRLNHALAQARRSKSLVAVMLFDLDHFKDVNDTLGHSLGDALLVEVSARFRACVREADTVARLGGDEFVFLLPGITSPLDASTIAEKALAVLEPGIMLDDNEVHISASCGISIYRPSDAASDAASDPERLLREADLALYRVKAEGRHATRFHSPDLTAAVSERKQLERDMRVGLGQGEFQVHYQPQISLADNKLIGMEALLRWTSKTRGSVSPAVFVPVAESSGLIVELGAWVMNVVCGQIKTWRSAGLHVPPVAINISYVQWARGKLDLEVPILLRKHGLTTSNLEMEVTEGVFFSTEETAALAVLQRLHASRVSIAIDDFGTGYSSLGQLRKLPIDKVKIDRSFIDRLGSDKDSESIVRAAIALAHAMGMSVVAEGVETPAQLDFLREAGCEFAQGYLLGRPEPASSLVTRLAGDWRSPTRPG